MLNLNKVSCIYQSETAVNNISFKVEHGERICLIGPSGCGKTTILRAIAGFQKLISGEIFINNVKVSDINNHVPPEKRRVGMVFQDHALYPHYNVKQNVGSGLRGLKKKEKDSIVDELTEKMGIKKYLKNFPHELSGGEQQRVALARALAPKPLLILMDEPFSSLDLELRQKLGSEVANILETNNITSIMVTHDQNDAFSYASKIGIINKGGLLQWDTPFNIYHKPDTKFVADFVGSSSYISGKFISNNKIQTSIGIFKVKSPREYLHKKNVYLLIRPDDVIFDSNSKMIASIEKKIFKGSDVLYTLKYKENQIQALIKSHINLNVGDKVAIRFDIDHIVVFNGMKDEDERIKLNRMKI